MDGRAAFYQLRARVQRRRLRYAAREQSDRLPHRVCEHAVGDAARLLRVRAAGMDRQKYRVCRYDGDGASSRHRHAGAALRFIQRYGADEHLVSALSPGALFRGGDERIPRQAVLARRAQGVGRERETRRGERVRAVFRHLRAAVRAHPHLSGGQRVHRCMGRLSHAFHV